MNSISLCRSQHQAAMLFSLEDIMQLPIDKQISQLHWPKDLFQKCPLDRWDSSVGRSPRGQAWWSELNPQNPWGGRIESSLPKRPPVCVVHVFVVHVCVLHVCVVHVCVVHRSQISDSSLQCSCNCSAVSRLQGSQPWLADGHCLRTGWMLRNEQRPGLQKELMSPRDISSLKLVLLSVCQSNNNEWPMSN